jgi:hypothetical protein
VNCTTLLGLSGGGPFTGTTDTTTRFHCAPQNGKRYLYPDDDTFLSWYPDFSLVKTVSDQDVSKTESGGTIAIRPGARRVTDETGAIFYSVGLCATRHLIPDAIGNKMYGSNWASDAVVIPAAYWNSVYHDGPALDGTNYPPGTFVFDQAKVFPAEGTWQYWVNSDGKWWSLQGASITDNRLNATYQVTTTGAMSGASIKGYLYNPIIDMIDPAQLTLCPQFL